MPIIVRENVEVVDEETEIIKPHETPSDRDRIFGVSNGDQDIEVKAWGSKDGETWAEQDSLVIPANNTGSLRVGLNFYGTKLTGKTTTPGTVSTVDACLIY